MLKNKFMFYFLTVLIVIVSCSKKETAVEILQKTISSIDTIESIYYKQDMWRTDPRNSTDSIFRYREMYFKRLITDSIVGVEGHWYMYVNDKEHVVYEDVYDGNRLIRKNNKDSVAMIYDLIKYPDFKRKHFWGHNTLYGMQHEFRFMLDNADRYVILRLNDIIDENRDCYQILVRLENYMTMPGFAIELQKSEGSVSKNTYFIDKKTLFPIRMKGENYSTDDPEPRVFIDQKYYDIKFNFRLDEKLQFNTSTEPLHGFKTIEIKPE